MSGTIVSVLFILSIGVILYISIKFLVKMWDRYVVDFNRINLD